jgi:hypothetical protein
METPNNRAGQVTEFVMVDVRAKLPDIPTWQYNRIWEAVYHRLESELQYGARRDGVGHIAIERSRQLQVEGWTAGHDDEHEDGELAVAAACYCLDDFEKWPWDLEWWKPTHDPIRDLTKAGALIAAEIDRLLRLKKS